MKPKSKLNGLNIERRGDHCGNSTAAQDVSGMSFSIKLLTVFGTSDAFYAAITLN